MTQKIGILMQQTYSIDNDEPLLSPPTLEDRSLRLYPNFCQQINKDAFGRLCRVPESSNRVFLKLAYLVILKRYPDTEAYNSYLGQLSHNYISKEDIIRLFNTSEINTPKPSYMEILKHIYTRGVQKISGFLKDNFIQLKLGSKS